jgi:Domain of unknown function (DUF4190)
MAFRCATDHDLVDEEAPPTSGTAIASVALGIFWLFGFGSVAALYLARRSLKEIEASDGAIEGRALAIAGAWIGVVGLAGTALLMAFIAASARH